MLEFHRNLGSLVRILRNRADSRSATFFSPGQVDALSSLPTQQGNQTADGRRAYAPTLLDLTATSALAALPRLIVLIEENDHDFRTDH